MKFTKQARTIAEIIYLSFGGSVRGESPLVLGFPPDTNSLKKFGFFGIITIFAVEINIKTIMKRLETLPTRSEWHRRLKYFYFHQEECMQGLKHCFPDVQFAYSIVTDIIQSSIFQKVGGCLVYSKSLEFYSYAEAMSFCLSVDLLINIILNIDFSNYSTFITKVESSEYKTFVVTLSLKTTIEVCA